ncbi:MAG TPA: biotin carboxylase N-terminal domain-containing protein, partial [Candidatus Limnocylindrales bacterium]
MTVESPPFTRVLIANRGEIAVRIIRACHEMGMEAVAVYSDADASAAHVRLADVAVRIGPPAPSESYLRIDAIVEAALASGAEAIHPGYGFLAERPSFARAVETAGLVFVGPASDAIETLGDKLHARRLAARVGVPSVPGTLEPAALDHPDQVAEILATAHRIGFPLLVKAAAGGGGRGMRRVTRAEDLAAALVSGSREAASAFGDGSVYLEREIIPARHIEVQLLADAHGHVVALGERDCSLQRRHQKLVEEA